MEQRCKPSWRWSFSACRTQTPSPHIPEFPASRSSSPGSRSRATRGTDASAGSRPGRSRRPSADPSPRTASYWTRQLSVTESMETATKTLICDECARLAFSRVLHHTWSRWSWRWDNRADSWADPLERCRRSDRLQGVKGGLKKKSIPSFIVPQQASAHKDHYCHHSKGQTTAEFSETELISTSTYTLTSKSGCWWNKEKAFVLLGNR